MSSLENAKLKKYSLGGGDIKVTTEICFFFKSLKRSVSDGCAK